MFSEAVQIAKSKKTETVTTIRKMENLVVLMEDGKFPDNQYLVTLLSRLPGKESIIFKKDYVYTRPKRAHALESYVFEDDDAFFQLNVNS